MNILSIQSWVAYGHVGNTSAMFPLQRLGADVWAINTVQFSNHPGYGAFTGTTAAPAELAALVDGIDARGVLAGCDALLSGYIGDPGTGPVLLHAAACLRRANPRALWACDPVIGDVGPGIYVRPGIAEFFRDQAVAAADILSPNQFELGLLTGMGCTSVAQIRAATAALQARMPAAGPRTILVTSVLTGETPAGSLDLIAATPDEMFRVRVPRLSLAVNGAGDAISALFLYHMVQTGSAPLAMGRAASSVHGLLSRTQAAGSRELLTVAAQEEYVAPTQIFEAHAL